MTELKDYTSEGLQKIEEVSLLSPENAETLSKLTGGLKEAWDNTCIWRTETEMRYSVLNDTKHPTRGMKFLQARLEQQTFFGNLMYLATEYEMKQGEKLELEGDLEELLANTELNYKQKRGQEIQLRGKIKQCEWNLIEMEKQGHHRVRELEAWERIKQELDDGSFDPTDYDAIQMEGLPERWKNQKEAGHNNVPNYDKTLSKST